MVNYEKIDLLCVKWTFLFWVCAYLPPVHVSFISAHLGIQEIAWTQTCLWKALKEKATLEVSFLLMLKKLLRSHTLFNWIKWNATALLWKKLWHLFFFLFFSLHFLFCFVFPVMRYFLDRITCKTNECTCNLKVKHNIFVPLAAPNQSTKVSQSIIITTIFKQNKMAPWPTQKISPSWKWHQMAPAVRVVWSVSTLQARYLINR